MSGLMPTMFVTCREATFDAWLEMKETAPA
jgi:hypothetical protein